MRYKKVKIISIIVCALFFFYGCTSLGHYGRKDIETSKWVKIIISYGVIVEKVDGINVFDAAGSLMERIMTVNPGIRTFLVRYWRPIPTSNPYEKGRARVSSHMTELKKEVQAGKVYRILSNETSNGKEFDVVFDITEVKD